MLRNTNLVDPVNTKKLFDAIDIVGPRVYQLSSASNSEKLKFFIIGCQGNGQESQHNVAKLMNDAAEKPDFVLVLGDNLYDDGASSPFDAQFEKYFDEVYDDRQVSKQLNGAKFFLIPGNHDYNLHKKARYKAQVYANGPQGREAGKNEVAHTYVSSWRVLDAELTADDDKFEASNQSVDTDKKIEIFSQNTLALEELDKWNMPYYFYSLICGKVQIFCLDSNTYASEMVEYTLHPERYETEETIKNNQAAWLLHEYKKAKLAGRKLILAQHHPFYTSGKRSQAKNYDTWEYLKQEELDTLKAILGTQSESYNELLHLIFQAQKMHFDIVCVAHDHCLQYYNEKTPDNPNGLCQITSGGGGGDLQKRVHFFGHEHIGCYLKNNGFVTLECDRNNPQEILIDFYSTAHHHLRFDHLNHYPICAEITDLRLKLIRKLILDSVDEYFSLLLSALFVEKKVHQEQSHTSYFLKSFSSTLSSLSNYMMSYENTKRDDIDEIHNITAYLNQVQLPTLDSAIAHLHSLFNKLNAKPTTDATHPFSAVLSQLGPIKQMRDANEITRFKENIVKKILVDFSKSNLPVDKTVASNLVEFAASLADDKHPFYALVNKNLAAHMQGVTLDDLYKNHIAAQARAEM